MKTEEIRMMKTAYSLKGYNGIFIIMSAWEDETHEEYKALRICDENYRVIVTAEEVQPVAQAAYMDSQTIFDICTEAVIRYHLDPARVLRGAIISTKRGMIGNASRDENGEPITPNPRVKWIRGSKGGFYTVKKGFCTCEDHKNGNICKHRIAAWIKDTQYIRGTAYAISQPRERIAAMYYAEHQKAEIEF